MPISSVSPTSPTSPSSSRPCPVRGPLPRLLVTLSLTLALGLPAGACSSDSPQSTSPGSTRATVAATNLGSAIPGADGDVGTSTSSTSPESTGGADPGSDATPPSTIVDPPGAVPGPGPTTTVVVSADDVSFCDRVKQGDRELGGLNPEADPPGALATYQRVVGELAALAPPAIKEDMDAINAAVQRAKTIDELQSAGTPALAAATERVDGWMTQRCGAAMGQQ